MKYFFKKSQKMIVYVLVAAMMLSGLMQYNLVNAEAATKTLHYEWSDTSKNSDAGITVSSDSTGKELTKNLSCDGTKYSKIYRIEKNKKLVIEVTGKGKFVFAVNSEASKDTSGGDTSEESTEASTEAPTEESTEAPTEESTEAPTEPSTEAPTEPSTEAPSDTTESEYEYSFDAKTGDTDLYKIVSGESLKNDKYTAVYNGKTYYKFLKFQSNKGSVAFTAPADGTLLMQFATADTSNTGNTIEVIVSEIVTDKLTIGENALLKVDVKKGVTYTFEKGDGESQLFYMCFTPAPAAPAVKHRVELDGNIGVTFAFKDAVAGSKVTFTCDGKDSVNVAYDASNVVTIDGTAYTMFSYNVYATEMNKVIKATLYDANGEVIKEDTCSVAQYCKEMLGKESTDDATKAAINALLVYGAEVDAYFEKDATWLKDVTDATLVPLTEAEINKLQLYPAQKLNQSGYEASDITASAASLYFDTQTAIRFYFSKKDGTPFTEAEAATLTEKYFFTDSSIDTIYKTTGYNKNGFYVEIPNIGPKNLDKTYRVAVHNNADGWPVQIVSYSAFTFVHNKLDDPKHTNLVTAIYRYNEALENYGTN